MDKDADSVIQILDNQSSDKKSIKDSICGILSVCCDLFTQNPDILRSRYNKLVVGSEAISWFRNTLASYTQREQERRSTDTARLEY